MTELLFNIHIAALTEVPAGELSMCEKLRIGNLLENGKEDINYNKIIPRNKQIN